MKTSQFTFTIIFVIALVALLTNPKIQDHQQAVKEKFKASMNKKMTEETPSYDEDGMAEFGKTLGNLLGGVIIDKLVDQMISIDNYVLFSLTKANWNGETKIIGLGVFGNVFISSEIDKKLEEGLLDDNY